MMDWFYRMPTAEQQRFRLWGILIAVILVLFVVLDPLYRRYEKADQDYLKLEREYQGIKSSIEDAAASRLAQIKLRKRAYLFPTQAGVNELPALLRQQVESLDGYPELLVRRVETAPPRFEEQVARTTVTIQFSGKLADLHRLLTAAETASPALKVDRSNVSTNQEDPSKVEGQMVFQGFGVVMEKVNKT